MKQFEKRFSKHKQQTAEAYELLAELLLLRSAQQAYHDPQHGSSPPAGTEELLIRSMGSSPPQHGGASLSAGTDEAAEDAGIAEAAKAISRSLEIKRSYLPAFDAAFATPYNIAGRIAEKQNQLNQAQQHYLNAFKNGFLKGQLVPPPACASLSNYASLLQEKDQHEMAIGVYERVVAFLEKFGEAVARENKTTYNVENDLVLGQAWAELGVAAFNAGMKVLATQSLQKVGLFVVRRGR